MKEAVCALLRSAGGENEPSGAGFAVRRSYSIRLLHSATHRRLAPTWLRVAKWSWLSQLARLGRMDWSDGEEPRATVADGQSIGLVGSSAAISSAWCHSSTCLCVTQSCPPSFIFQLSLSVRADRPAIGWSGQPSAIHPASHPPAPRPSPLAFRPIFVSAAATASGHVGECTATASTVHSHR